MPRHVINMAPDEYEFNDPSPIHENIWKAASNIANAPLRLAQIRMDEEDRAHARADRSQAQEDRRIGLADRDRAFNAAQAEREYQHGEKKHTRQKEKNDWIRNRAKDLSPNKDIPNKDAFKQAVKDWADVNGEAQAAPTRAPVDPAVQPTPAPTQQEGSDADVLRDRLKALGGSPTYTPSPIRPTSMDAGSTAMPSRFGQAVQGLPQENEWTGKPMPQVAQSGATAAPRFVDGVDIDRPAEEPRTYGSTHRKVMGVDIDQPAGGGPESGALLMDRGMMGMEDLPEEARWKPPVAANPVVAASAAPSVAAPQRLANNAESNTPEGGPVSYTGRNPGVQLVMDPGYQSPTDMAGQQRQAFTNLVNDARMQADPGGTTYGAGFGYTPLAQQPADQTLRSYFNNYRPTESDIQSADVRVSQQDAANNAAVHATMRQDPIGQKIYMDPWSIPFRPRNPITRPPAQAVAPAPVPDMYQLRGLSRGQ